MPTNPVSHFHLSSLTAIALLVLTVITGVHPVSAATEEPKYTLLETLEGMEVRQYEATVQAYTSMDSGGFRNLAGYIFGGNSGDTEIAMTAPVTTTLGQANAEMAFTMPVAWTIETLPTPDDSNVKLRSTPAFTAAVIEFSGWASRGAYMKQLETLRQRLQQYDLTAIGEPVLNQYDPPWKLPFLRRNEVMVAIEWPAQQGLPGSQPGS